MIRFPQGQGTADCEGDV